MECIVRERETQGKYEASQNKMTPRSTYGVRDTG